MHPPSALIFGATAADRSLGTLLELDSQYAEARVAFERVYFTALAAGHHAVAIDAAIAREPHRRGRSSSSSAPAISSR